MDSHDARTETNLPPSLPVLGFLVGSVMANKETRYTPKTQHNRRGVEIANIINDVNTYLIKTKPEAISNKMGVKA